MARITCTTCGYVSQHCLCDFVKPIVNKSHVMILQHPSEQNAAKNTAKLVGLSLTNVDIFIGETPEDFTSARELLALSPASTLVVYPSDSSLPIESHHQASKDTIPANLIFIDGTWKKALKLIKLNPWLEAYQFVSFNTLPNNRYMIRKAPRQDSLSTLEAVALSLEATEQCDTSNLYTLLDKLNENHMANMPDDVKRRYYDRT